MIVYGAPGRADELDGELAERWDEVVHAAHRRLEPSYGGRFFSLDPAPVPVEQRPAARWFADPSAPAGCLGADTARVLCDWGVRGRRVLHTEYCEYAPVHRFDADGTRRLKRVVVTTELRELWLTVATYRPEAVVAMAVEALGHPVDLQDLYGPGGDPHADRPEVRQRRFATWTAGHGNDRSLAGAGVPAQPRGPLATDNALFMTHPINGLDDLLYVVMLGAHPFRRPGPDGGPASMEQIARHTRAQRLVAHHADPTLVMAAAEAAYEGRVIAFADPLGMYVASFAGDVFSLDGDPVPVGWTRLSRGREGMWQRLEFGPGDDDPRFLDEAVVASGAREERVTGGFQVVEQVEVGPLLVVGPPGPVRDDEWVTVTAPDGPIGRAEAGVCPPIEAFLAEYEAAQRPVQPAPRLERG